jgi:site-specific DNA recombinase
MEAIQNSNGKRRVAVYIRVSTAEQKIDGYGLEAQKTKLLDHINNNPALGLYTKPEWLFCDTHTGSDLNRPALNDLRKQVKQKKFDAIIVWKIDRLSRSLKHLLLIFEELKSNDASFISVQENIDFKGPIGSLIFQIFGAIAEFERELIKGRTIMGKIASAEMGNYTGSTIPYGYRPVKRKGEKGKRLEIIPKEKKWVEEIYSWYIYEELGFGQIANKLNELQVPRGEHSRARDKYSKWTDKMVHVILTNPLYRGEFVANKRDEDGILLAEKEWTIVEIPPCVSEFTFQQAQNARTGRKGGATDTDYLLSGKLKDMTLESPKTFIGAKRSKGGFSYRRKQFKKKDGTHIPVFEIPGKQIEEYVWGKIMEAMKSPEVFIEHYLTKEYTDTGKIEQIQRNIAHLREQKMNTEMSITRIESAYESGNYSEEKMAEKVAEKNTEIVKIEEEIQRQEDELSFISSVDIETQKLKSASEQVKYRLEKLTRKQKKILCNLFVDRVEMYRKKKGQGWEVSAEIYFRFNPEKFTNPTQGGRTQKEEQEAKKDSLKSQKVRGGARERT